MLAASEVEILIYVLAWVLSVYILISVSKKYGLVSLLILSAPIHRLAIDVGFSLKLFYIVTFVLFFVSLLESRKKLYTIKVNDYFFLIFLFFISVVLSALMNGASIVSIRRIGVFSLVFFGCYFLYVKTNTVEDLERLQNVYLLTGLLLGISGLFFYVFYFFYPELYVEGGFFDAVTHDKLRLHTWPLLQSFDVGSNGYAMTLVPFIFVAIGSLLSPASRFNKKFYAALVMLLLMVNLGLTFSRGTLIAVLLTILVLVFYIKRHRMIKFTAVISMFLLLIFSSQLFQLYKGYSYLKGSYSGENTALLSERDQLLTSSLNTYAENPVFGVGQGNIVEPRYVGKQTHNTYVELLAENGIFSFFIFMLIMIFLFRKIQFLNKNSHHPRIYYIFISFTFGLLGILIAAIPTSAITMPLFWIQLTLVFSMARIVKISRSEIR